MAAARVSVVIPAFGRASLLETAVNSALAEGDICGEVVVVDDASPEPIDRAPCFADPRVRLVRHATNGGAAAARNTGIQAARHPLVAFLDSDDAFLPGRIATLVAGMEASGNPLHVVGSGWIETRNGVVREVVPSGAASLDEFATGCWFNPGSTLVLRREVFDVVGLFDDRLRRLEDYEWFLRFGAAGGRLEICPQPLAAIGFHRTTKVEDVRRSAALIANDYLRDGGRLRVADRVRRRKIAAFLRLVEAAALYYSGARVRSGFALLNSLLLSPRLRLLTSPPPRAVTLLSGSLGGGPNNMNSFVNHPNG